MRPREATARERSDETHVSRASHGHSGRRCRVLSAGFAILVAGGLGFLGFGVEPPTPESGTMLGKGRQHAFRAPGLTTYPWARALPGRPRLHLFGDGRRDTLDPRTSRFWALG